MGYLAAAGAYLIIGLVVSFILMVVGLFIGHIIVFDSIALGIISGVCCNHFFTLHPALCVLIGAAVFALLLFLQKTRFGFWVIGVLLSAAWAVIFGCWLKDHCGLPLSIYFSISRQEIRHKTRVASGTLRAENACVSAASRARKLWNTYLKLKKFLIPQKKKTGRVPQPPRPYNFFWPLQKE